MILVRLIIMLLIIGLALGQTLRFTAWLSGEDFISYNESLEGYYIIKHRKALAEGRYPNGHYLLLAGSSRTLADYSADVVGDVLSKELRLQKQVMAYNLGNVSNNYSLFERNLLRNGLPQILILEFSPHLFYLNRDDNQTKTMDYFHSMYRLYQDWRLKGELFLAGVVKSFLGMSELFQIKRFPHSYSIALFSDEDLDLKTLYYALRVFSGAGERICRDGQVLYRVYLPNRLAAMKVRGFWDVELPKLEKIMSQALNEKQWEGLSRIVHDFSSERKMLVVVRPPVDSRLYEMENRMAAELVQDVERYLASRGIPYIDLNPNDYFSCDMSHLDWYETGRLSEYLGKRLANVIRTRSLARDDNFGEDQSGLSN